MLNHEELRKAIPHRYPFLMVDRVTIVEEGKKAVGMKCVSGNEPFFLGHFPQQAIMPGVLIVEAMAQTGCALFLSRPEMAGKLAYFMAIENAKFRHPVLPGDVLQMEIEVTHSRARYGKCKGVARANGQVACEAEFSFAIVDREPT